MNVQDIIRGVYDPKRERRALTAWRERYSLVDRIRRLMARDRELGLRLAAHAERWGWTGLVEDLRAYRPQTCSSCGGTGRWGDDIPCGFCDGEGVV